MKTEQINNYFRWEDFNYDVITFGVENNGKYTPNSLRSDYQKSYYSRVTKQRQLKQRLYASGEKS